MCLSKKPIYAKSEDFDFVENFIRSHCANAKAMMVLAGGKTKGKKD